MSLLISYVKRHVGKIILGIVLLWANSALAVLPALVSQMLFDNGFLDQSLLWVIACCLLLVILALAQSVLSVAAVRVFSQIGETVVSDMRIDMTNAALVMPSTRTASLGTGYIMSRIDEVGRIGSLFSSSNLTFLGSVAQSIISFVLLWGVSWHIALFSVLPTFLFLLVSRMVAKEYRDVLRASLETHAAFSGKVNECLKGRDEILLNEGVKREKEGIAYLSNRLKKRGIRQSVVLSGASETYRVLNVVAMGLVYLLCGAMVIDNSLTVGQVVAISQYVSKVYSPIVLFSTVSIAVQPAFEALDRLKNIFGDTYRVEDRDGKRIDKIKTLSITNLRFAYPGSPNYVINGLSFTASKPGLYVIHGKNGEGKTTLARLILGLISGYEGSISINGSELGEISEVSLRRVTSMVNQTPFLFNSSIRDNILYGKKHVSKNVYYRICHIAGIDNICERLPLGDLSNVGEAGALLSSGERQKISLARALLRNSELIVFDEPTSGLDKNAIIDLRKTIRWISGCSLVIMIDHTGAFDNLADTVISL